MGSGSNNWTKEETGKELKKRAQRILDAVKENQKGKKYKSVKISDQPKTFKLVEIKDEHTGEN